MGVGPTCPGPGSKPGGGQEVWCLHWQVPTSCPCFFPVPSCKSSGWSFTCMGRSGGAQSLWSWVLTVTCSFVDDSGGSETAAFQEGVRPRPGCVRLSILKSWACPLVASSAFSCSGFILQPQKRHSGDSPVTQRGTPHSCPECTGR